MKLSQLINELIELRDVYGHGNSEVRVNFEVVDVTVNDTTVVLVEDDR